MSQTAIFSADSLVLLSPLSGKFVELAEVPDPVFSTGMLGPGVAILPEQGCLRAPCSGVVTQLAETAHALTLTSVQGAQILLHIGIDTVQMGGTGFHARVQQGSWVEAGQVLIDFDLAAVQRLAVSSISVLLIANPNQFRLGQHNAGQLDGGHSQLLVLHALHPAAQESTAELSAAGEVRRSLRLTVAGGLHARPAARARAAQAPFDALLQLQYGERCAPLDSVVALLALGAGEQAMVELIGRGPQAEQAVEAVCQVLQCADNLLPAGQTASPVSVTRIDTPLSSGDTRASTTLYGVCAVPGIAIGTVVLQDANIVEVDPVSSMTPAQEKLRLQQALRAVDASLALSVAQAGGPQQKDLGEIFTLHRILLQDPVLTQAADDYILLGKSAAFAWQQAISHQLAQLEHAATPLLVERAADLRDLVKQVLRTLGYGSALVRSLPTGAICVADEITPSDLAALANCRVAALLMADGGATSHAALMARQLGIPTLVGLGPAVKRLAAGSVVLVDAAAGQVLCAPTSVQIEQARQQQQLQQQVHAMALASATQPALTRDGQRIDVAANIGTLEEAHSALQHGADGVGLLRTELLFMQRQQAPGAAEQAACYQAIVDALQGRPVILRTLDAGADKPVAFLSQPDETNPALGLRGIRLAQQQPEWFDHQLTGMLQVQSDVPLRILLPMVTEVAELVQIRQRIEALARSAGRQQPFELGVMIEVPAAALLAEQLARHADFFAIGSNDLTQYTLAMDRCHPALATRADGLQPAVLRLIELAVQGARRHGRWVGLCGALAGDPLAIPILLGLGVTELSAPPLAVPAIKARVRQLDLVQCTQQARALLALESAAQVREASQRCWPESVAVPTVVAD